jgi:hypothetical protein
MGVVRALTSRETKDTWARTYRQEYEPWGFVRFWGEQGYNHDVLSRFHFAWLSPILCHRQRCRIPFRIG